MGPQHNSDGTWTYTYTLLGLVTGSYNIKFTADNKTKTLGQKALDVGATDCKFEYSPATPVPGQEVTVKVTAPIPFAWIELKASGPSYVFISEQPIIHNDDGTITWPYKLSGLIMGQYTIQFIAEGVEVDRDTLYVGVNPIQIGINPIYSNLTETFRVLEVLGEPARREKQYLISGDRMWLGL